MSGRGYWQKVEAGLPVQREPLRDEAGPAASDVVFSAHEIRRRRTKAPDAGPIRIDRVPRKAPIKKPPKTAWVVDVPAPPIPRRPRWAGPKGPALNVLSKISDWHWGYEFHVMRPEPRKPWERDDTLRREDPYLETHSIQIFATVLLPKKRAGEYLRMKLGFASYLDARDEGQTRAAPVGEWWKERGTLLADVIVPQHASAAMVGALVAGKVVYLTVSGQAYVGRGTGEIYGVEFGTTYDAENWE